MASHCRYLVVLLAVAACGSVAAAQPGGDEAGDKCESAVAETITRMRGRSAQEVQFAGTKRALTPASEDETGVRGEGRYRGPAGRSMPFSYSCYYNVKNGATSGVVIRDAAANTAGSEAAWQPDLTHVSPEACESAAAADLKDKHPRVGKIVLGSDSRQVRPGPDGHILLEGRGAVQRAPGMSAVPFSYRCEFEGKGGRVVGVQTLE
jgi:hypothetical protein